MKKIIKDVVVFALMGLLAWMLAFMIIELVPR